MRVAFLSANREMLPDAAVPIGVLYVMAATPERHERELWDLLFQPDPEAFLRDRLAAFRPDVVAFGMRNIQQADYSGTSDNLRYYASLMATIRAHGDATVVMGGSGFSVMPRELMAELRPDFGLPGEGEEALPALLDALERDGSLDAIPGLLRFEDGAVVANPRAPGFLDMNALRAPDRTVLDARYYEEFGIDSLQTKRGCPLLCDYCTYPTIEGRIGRRREPGLVADEMARIRLDHPDVRHVFVVDSVFNLPPSHAKDVCRALIAQGNTVPWTCYANPLRFDEELGGLMRAAGCVGMEVGADSGCDEILLALRKGFDTRAIRKLRGIAAATGLKDCQTFILGTRGETLDHVRRTLDFVVDLDPFAAILMVWIDDAEALDPALAQERRRLREEIFLLLEECKHDFPRWIIPPLGVNFEHKRFGYLRRVGFHGPLWQHLDHMPARRRRRRTDRATPS